MKYLVIILFLISLLISGCNQSVDGLTPTVTDPVVVNTPTPQPSPTVTQEPLKTLTVCTASFPTSLFPYDGTHSVAKENILSIIQPNPFEEVDGEWTALIFERVPSQANGDLRMETVLVQGGQRVVDARGDLAVLTPGSMVRPSGCRQGDCAVTWDGESPIEMDRMVIDFELREGLTWSDGTPVTPADSVFSYQLASAPQAPGLKWAEERTDSYGPMGEQTVQWVGRPGFSTTQLNPLFWNPLPSHLFAGNEDWAALSVDERLTASPLSYGPFVLSAWEGDSIRFEANPYYFRLDEGLPSLDVVTFRLIEDGPSAAWDSLESVACDVLDTSFGFENDPELLETIQEAENVSIRSHMGASWTQLVFGVQPASFDDFGPLGDAERPDFFGDVRVRKGVAYCLDRQAMLLATLGGLGNLWPSFLPPERSQLGSSARIIRDPELGLAYLTQAGWIDHDNDPDTPLQAWNAANVPAGTSLSVELIISQSQFHQDLGVIVKESLANCGMDVTVTALPAAELYAPGPEGALFGRRFDLSLLSWGVIPEPDCRLYQSWRIPSGENQWIGTNIAGLSEEDYDQACTEANLALPEEQKQALYGAEQAFVDLLPAVPLFGTPEVMVFNSQGCVSDLPNSASFYMKITRIMNNSGCQ